MKKILMAIALIACLVFPLSSMALTTIDDSDLSTVTGQAGVSINLDANVNLSATTFAWGDMDGLGAASGAASAGWVGIKDLNANVRIKLRDDLISSAFVGATTGALQFAGIYGADLTAYGVALTTLVGTYNAAYGKHLLANSSANLSIALAAMEADTVNDYTALGLAYTNFDAAKTVVDNDIATSSLGVAYSTYETASNKVSPLTIDVATGGDYGANVTFVRIGLGSIGIYVSSMNGTVALGGGAVTPTLDQQLGSFYINNLNILISNVSYVDIYNDRTAGEQGVTLGLNVKLDEITIGSLAWGDSDGFVTTNYAPSHATNTTASTSAINSLAGYVGLRDTTIAGLGIYGPVTIDVATSAAGVKEAGETTTFVRIGFSGLNVQVGAVDATAVIGSTSNFAAGTYDTFGTIYMSGLDMTFGANNYVDIYNYHGKSGVVLDFNISFANFDITTLSWGDADGLGSYAGTSDGFVGLQGLFIDNLVINGVATIDVATVDGAPLTAKYGNNTTFVRLGFNDTRDPGVTVGFDTLNTKVALGDAKDNLTQELGSVYFGATSATITGYVDIMAAGNGATQQGVVLYLDLSVAVPSIAAISWGDNDVDGIGDGLGGYVGLTDLAITGLTVAGKVTIDVARNNDPTYSLMNSTITLMYEAYKTHSLSPTSHAFVHIGLGTGNAEDATTAANTLAIGITSLAANVGLDSVKELTNVGIAAGDSGMLGKIYIGGLSAKVNGWVDIAAH